MIVKIVRVSVYAGATHASESTQQTMSHMIILKRTWEVFLPSFLRSKGNFFICAPLEDAESAFFHDVLLLPTSSEWMDAMDDGMSSLQKNQV